MKKHLVLIASLLMNVRLNFYLKLLHYISITVVGKVLEDSDGDISCESTSWFGSRCYKIGAIYKKILLDIRSNNKGKIVSRSQLWKWFNVDSFNMYLDCDPERVELLHSLAMKKRYVLNRRCFLIQVDVYWC